jgi:hypothetical protein
LKLLPRHRATILCCIRSAEYASNLVLERTDAKLLRFSKADSALEKFIQLEKNLARPVAGWYSRPAFKQNRTV